MTSATTNTFDYASDWSDLTYPETNDITFDNTIRSSYRRVDLRKEHFEAGGIPILVKDNYAYLNDLTENTLIFGQTGSKKTRCAIGPDIIMTAGAGESAFVTDVKGELSSNPKIRGFLEDHGVRTIMIDFRTFDKDGFNILEHAYKLYKSGQKDKSMAECAVLLNMLASKYERGAKDPFWHGNAKQYLRPLIEMVFRIGVDSGDDEKVNLLSLSALCNRTTSDVIAETFKEHPSVFEAKLMPNNLASLKAVVDNPPNTMANILSTAQTMLEEFTLQPDLTKMLSKTTFDVESMYEKPTCVFLVVPDETSAYDATAGMLIDSFYGTLIEAYSKKYMNKQEPKCRINFICDEFCNLAINDMKAKISASRGRAMRWVLVCQSKDQMETSYGAAAGTIVGNCQNTLFLQSCDENLLDYICRMCGTTEVSRSGSEPLVTPDMLKTLRKEIKYKEALFINDKIRYFTRLPDIDSYDFLNKYAEQPKKRGRKPAGNKFTTLTGFDIDDIISVFGNQSVQNDDYDTDDFYNDVSFVPFTDEDFDESHIPDPDSPDFDEDDSDFDEDDSDFDEDDPFNFGDPYYDEDEPYDDDDDDDNDDDDDIF